MFHLFWERARVHSFVRKIDASYKAEASCCIKFQVTVDSCVWMLLTKEVFIFLLFVSSETIFLYSALGAETANYISQSPLPVSC